MHSSFRKVRTRCPAGFDRLEDRVETPCTEHKRMLDARWRERSTSFSGQRGNLTRTAQSPLDISTQALTSTKD